MTKAELICPVCSDEQNRSEPVLNSVLDAMQELLVKESKIPDRIAIRQNSLSKEEMQNISSQIRNMTVI